MHTPYKKIHLKFLKPLNKLLLVNLVLSILLTGIAVLLIATQGKQITPWLIINIFLITSPILLFVLCIIASLKFSIELSKKNVSIQNLSRFESLLKFDVLCLEKANIIVDGNLEIRKVIPLNAVASEQYIAQWLSNLLRATNDSGDIYDALKQKYDLELSAGVVSVLPYNDQIKYSGASFKGGKTIVVGDLEFVPVKNKVGILKRCEEQISKGCKIVVLAEGKEQISDNGYPGELDGVALIVLKEHIRKEAFETFKWFKNNGPQIKVISSDDALVTSVAAAEAGIDNADKYISLEGIENIENAADQYTVFGKATPEQKASLIKAFKEGGQKVVFMSGDSNNNLPMKKADLSIATDGVNADLVLTNNSLDSLVETTREGNRFVCYLQKATALCLAKMILSFAITLLFVILFVANVNSYKLSLFAFNHLLLCDLITNGIGAILLLFEKNKDKVDGSFFKKVLNNAIPTAILQVLGLLILFVAFAMQQGGLLNFGLYTSEVPTTMSLIFIVVTSIIYLYNIYAPLNKFRAIKLASVGAANILAIAAFVLITQLDTGINGYYSTMNGPAWLFISIIAIVLSAIYLFVCRFIAIIKGDINDEN